MNSKGRTRKRFTYSGIALVTSLVLLTSTAAYAGLLATGAVYGGPNTHTETCYLFNAGTTPVKVLAATIVGENGPLYADPLISGSSPITFNSCGSLPAFLGPNQTCGVSVHDNTNQAWSCSFRIKDGTKDIRGVMDLRDINNLVLINSNLR